MKSLVTSLVYTRYLLLSSAFFFSFSADAKISLPAFKSVSQVFHENTRLYSPTLGIPALESGLLENLRFFNIIAAYKEDGSRDYELDQAFNNDAMATLIIKLFPSTGGQLSTTSMHAANFGRYVRDPRSVALLLNFAFAVEKDGAFDKTQAVENILASLNLATYQRGHELASQTMKNGLLKLQKSVNKLSKEPLEAHLLRGDLLELAARLPKDYGSTLTQLFQTKSLLNNKKINANLWKSLNDKSISSINNTYNAIVRDWRRDMKKSLRSLLDAIELSIMQANAFYPVGTTQQIINAFFCQHFNTKEDIKNLLINLDEQIINARLAKNLDVNDYIKESDLFGIANKRTYNFDDILALLTQDIHYYSPTPYRQGTALLSNQVAHPYDRIKDQILETISFADCTEMALRHIINLLIYDSNSRAWNLSSIEGQENNPYFQKLKAFYDSHGPETANAGDIKTRSLWNSVVGDLNCGDSNGLISYIDGHYNLDGGLINTIRVFEKLLGLSLGKEVGSIENWIIKSFNTIFNVLNPQLTYKLAIKNTDKLNNNTILTVEVVEKNNYGSLFSFEYFSMPGIHSQINNFQIKKEIKKANRIEFDDDFYTLKKDSAEISLRLMASHQSSALIYRLMASREWKDSINDLSFFMDHKFKNESIPADLILINNILKNILNKFPWGDNHSVKLISKSLLSLMKINSFKETIKSITKSIIIEIAPAEEVVRIINELDMLEYLSLSLVTFSDGLPALENLRALKSITLKSISGLKKIDFRKMGNLEQITIDYANGLEKINLDGLKNLADLTLKRNLELGKIKGLETLEKLKNFNFSDNKKIEQLELYGLYNLEQLTIENMHNLSELGIGKMKKLNRFSLTAACLLKEIEGFDYLKKVKNIRINQAIDYWSARDTYSSILFRYSPRRALLKAQPLKQEKKKLILTPPAHEEIVIEPEEPMVNAVELPIPVRAPSFSRDAACNLL